MQSPDDPEQPLGPSNDPAAALRRRMSALLVKVANEGDKAAFGEIFDHFAPRVKAYLMRLGAPGPQAEDLAQDVMVTVLLVHDRKCTDTGRGIGIVWGRKRQEGTR